MPNCIVSKGGLPSQLRTDRAVKQAGRGISSRQLKHLLIGMWAYWNLLKAFHLVSELRVVAVTAVYQKKKKQTRKKNTEKTFLRNINPSLRLWHVVFKAVQQLHRARTGRREDITDLFLSLGCSLNRLENLFRLNSNIIYRTPTSFPSK